jgi:photosystem II stability/assembly factor-like uncharacterized protein
VIASPTIEDTGWLTVDQGWLISGSHLFWTADGGKSWQDISPASLQIASFLPSGEAWALSGVTDAVPTLYTSSTRGASWESHAFSLPDGEWQPLQLQLTSPTNGWLEVRLATSPAFDAGLLLKTSDGGLTWQSYDLPATGKITFTSPSDGWLMDADAELLFHTSDGGLTWQKAELGNYPLPKVSLPAGTALSGWQAGGLTWAATSNGACQGSKGEDHFTCQVDHQLWQSVDGGKSWQVIPLPVVNPITQ